MGRNKDAYVYRQIDSRIPVVDFRPMGAMGEMKSKRISLDHLANISCLKAELAEERDNLLILQEIEEEEDMYIECILMIGVR